MVVDKSENRVRQMFSQIAGRYDTLNHLLSLNTDRYWRWRTVRKLSPLDRGPILDCCTGTGDLAIALHKATGGRVQVVGSDFCHEMLTIARQKGARRQGGQSLEFVEADTMNLPFASDLFQIVTVAFGLRNVADTDAGLREMLRVCRPGGQVAVLEFSSPNWQPFKSIYSWYFRNVLPRIGQLLSRNRFDAYHYLPESVGEFPSGESLAQRMRDVGMTNVSFTPYTLGVATLYIGSKPTEPQQEDTDCGVQKEWIPETATAHES